MDLRARWIALEVLRVTRAPQTGQRCAHRGRDERWFRDMAVFLSLRAVESRNTSERLLRVNRLQPPCLSRGRQIRERRDRSPGGTTEEGCSDADLLHPDGSAVRSSPIEFRGDVPLALAERAVGHSTRAAEELHAVWACAVPGVSESGSLLRTWPVEPTRTFLPPWTTSSRRLASSATRCLFLILEIHRLLAAPALIHLEHLPAAVQRAVTSALLRTRMPCCGKSWSCCCASAGGTSPQSRRRWGRRGWQIQRWLKRVGVDPEEFRR
jgi:hypothetical protein